MSTQVSVKSFVMKDGERYCLLVNSNDGLPLFYPNLYVTTQIRNNSLSFSVMQSALGAIAVLLKFLEERGENIEVRFRQHKFFEIHELDALRDFCLINFTESSRFESSNSVFNIQELRDSDFVVSLSTCYSRLSNIAEYIEWFAGNLLGVGIEKNVALQINRMINGIKVRRPVRKSRNKGIVETGLDESQLELIFELLRPESKLNPFDDESIRVRNRLIILLLFHLGIRRGELLNIRIQDIDFGSNLIGIYRRADQKDDSRLVQPNTKTLDRLIPLKDTLAHEIHLYILKHRKLIVRKNQPDYLIVTHKDGPTKGCPLSISSYSKLITIVKLVSPKLHNFYGHQLRKAWNFKFSELMDSMNSPPSEERQEEMRSNIMGWKQGSGTAQIYNQRFIKKMAHEVALKIQDGMINLPKGIKHE